MEIITTKDLALFMDVDIATIRRWINAKLIPAPTKIGHKVFWPRADIESFIGNRQA